MANLLNSRGTSVALSGGGHRATLFSLGVLMYLADAGKNREVGSISSVSGGSITNGFVAQCGNFQDYDGPRFEKEVAGPLTSVIARKGTFFAPLRTKVYLILLGLGLPAAFAPLWVKGWPPALRIVVVALLVAFWARFQLGGRGTICALAFRDTLFSPQGRATQLAEICTEVDHVFCATDLRAAEHVYLSCRFVYGYRFGLGTPGDLPLYDAVQASASFPGGFPPKVLPTKRFGFKGAPASQRPKKPPRSLVLIDGGVYDNMAEQWAVGFEARAQRLASLQGQIHGTDELLVVNAAAGNQWRPFPGRWIPLVSEFASLLRVIDVLYENTTTTRRQRLRGSCDRAAKAGSGMTGALIQITQSPFVVATYFEREGALWPGRAVRARAALDALGRDKLGEWKLIAEASARVATVLSALGTETSASLLHHAYVLAMCNLHVLLGYPLLEVPARARFTRLTEPAPPPTSEPR